MMTLVCLKCGADKAEGLSCRVCDQTQSLIFGAMAAADSSALEPGEQTGGKVMPQAPSTEPLSNTATATVPPTLEKPFSALSAAQAVHIPRAVSADPFKIPEAFGSSSVGVNSTLDVFTPPASAMPNGWKWLVIAAVLTGATVFFWMTSNSSSEPELGTDSTVSLTDDTMKLTGLAASSSVDALLLPEPESGSASASEHETAAMDSTASAPSPAPANTKRTQRAASDRSTNKPSASASVASPPKAHELAHVPAATPTARQPDETSPTAPLKGPHESCASKGLLARATCVSDLCAKPAFAPHVDCKRLQMRREQEEQQRLSGGS
jgi:hypothetical protein